MSEWTEEPWELLPQRGAGPMLVKRTEDPSKQMQPTSFRLIAHCLERGDSLATDKANAQRIVTCVNEFAGIPNPAEFMAGVREVVDAPQGTTTAVHALNRLRALLARVEKTDLTHQRIGGAEMTEEQRRIVEFARKATTRDDAGGSLMAILQQSGGHAVARALVARIEELEQQESLASGKLDALAGAWRGSWHGFDGRTLRRQLESARCHEESHEEFTNTWGICRTCGQWSYEICSCPTPARQG